MYLEASAKSKKVSQMEDCMKKVISKILFSLALYSLCSAQQQPYGYKFSGDNDILSDIFFIQNGFVLDSINNSTTNITYKFEYNGQGRLTRDINFIRYRVLKNIGNPRPIYTLVPGTRDYYYNTEGNIDSVGYGYWNDSLWLNDSSGYTIHYATDGKLISKIHSTKDTVTSMEEYSYNSNGTLLSYTLQDYANQDTICHTREYDLQNRLTLINYYRSGNQSTPASTSQRLYRYDSSGNIDCTQISIDNSDTVYHYNWWLSFDEAGKTSNEIFYAGSLGNSTWQDTTDIAFNYDESGRLLTMGSIVRFHYDIDGNLDTLINTHSILCGYLGNTATLIDSYGNTIKLSDCSGSSCFYYSKQVTGVHTDKINVKTFSLSQNYPNPFNPLTTISYSIPLKAYVSLKVFDLLGREVATIVSEEIKAGNYSKQWNANTIASGVYFYRLQAGFFTETKKLILLK
jgi:hypothetical protein